MNSTPERRQRIKPFIIEAGSFDAHSGPFMMGMHTSYTVTTAVEVRELKQYLSVMHADLIKMLNMLVDKNTIKPRLEPVKLGAVVAAHVESGGATTVAHFVLRRVGMSRRAMRLIWTPIDLAETAQSFEHGQLPEDWYLA